MHNVIKLFIIFGIGTDTGRCMPYRKAPAVSVRRKERGRCQVLVGELKELMETLPPDAHINIYVDQDIRITSDAWSGAVEAHVSEYYEAAELIAETVWDGPR